MDRKIIDYGKVKVYAPDSNRIHGSVVAGDKFGRLTATKYLGLRAVSYTDVMWEWLCDCGNTTIAAISNVKYGKQKSCGCLYKEIGYARNKKHGKTRTKEYRCWLNLRDRCLNKDNSAWDNYGGRGISVCDRWMNSFDNFFADMGMSPPGTSIDRINNDGNYEPGNCKWSTRTEQRNNRRDSTKPKVTTKDKLMTTKINSVKELIAAINADAKAPVVLDAENAYSVESEAKLIAEFSAGMPLIKVEPNEKGEHKLTIDNMDALDKYRANFHEALGTVTAPLIAEKAKADPEIGAMEVKLQVGETTFSTAFARPTGDAPSQKELAASIGFGYSTIKNKGLEGKVRKEFAKLWLEADEDEEGDDE